MDLSQAIDKVKPSIVHILFMASGFTPEMNRRLGRHFISKPLGTGFMISKEGYVITAYHVLGGIQELMNKFKEAEEKQVYVGFAQPNTKNMRGNFALVRFNITDNDKQHDLVLLKLEQNPFKGKVSPVIGNMPMAYDISFINPNRPKDGAAIGISGYPLDEPVLVTNAGWMATTWAFNINEVSEPGTPEWFHRPEIEDSYLADVKINPGNSGAPVYLVEDATIIGVCIGYKPDCIRNNQGGVVKVDKEKLFYNSGLAIVVPSYNVIKLLEKNNIKYKNNNV